MAAAYPTVCTTQPVIIPGGGVAAAVVLPHHQLMQQQMAPLVRVVPAANTAQQAQFVSVVPVPVPMQSHPLFVAPGAPHAAVQAAGEAAPAAAAPIGLHVAQTQGFPVAAVADVPLQSAAAASESGQVSAVRDSPAREQEGGGRGDAALGRCDEGPQVVRTPADTAGRNLIVNGLPLDMDSKELATLFHRYGRVISSRVIRDASTKQSKGYGFVEFDDAAAAKRAIEKLSGHALPGRSGEGSRVLKVSFARPHKVTPDKRSLNVYVSGFRDCMTAADIARLCRRHGHVMDAKVLCKEYHSDGVAFVHMSTLEEADAVCSNLHGVDVRSVHGEIVQLCVRYADKVGKASQARLGAARRSRDART
eukprot:TRINITY_DN21462_c3_g1_i1.p1 TRINITY_DN21462_c3_g1~~TRINITY_DN21462_c3_g1_i1.p1  ORF type:complete len:363 (+),score=21.63 TRINITY_DN21462_c3_g1_i1:539-1627(+)